MKKIKVLMIDDNIQLVDMVKEYFSSHAVIEVLDSASNGNEGLTEDDYSILFNYISIKAINGENKKIKVFSEDLG